MAEAVTFQAVSDAIRKGRVAPVYMLHGEEGFYIDAISKSVENLVPESDRDFNPRCCMRRRQSRPLWLRPAAATR